MSLVIAIKDKNRIVLGADKQISAGDSKNHASTKIWEVPDLEGAIMGGVGSARASQVIQYSSIVDKNLIDSDLSTNFIVCSLAPTIAQTLKANGVVVDVPNEGLCELMPNSFICAYKDKAWMIWNDLSVSEIEDYFAIGSGSDVAQGALFATKDKDPFTRIVTSIDAAAETTLFVDNGIDLLATDTEPSDEKLIAKALKLEIQDEVAKKKKKSKK